MDDYELDKKKLQRQSWVRQRDYMQFKIKAGLRLRDILTEIPTEELSRLLDYAVKGIEQEIQTAPISSYEELNKVENAHDVMVIFITSLVGTGKFPKDKTLQELSESMKIVKHFIARQYLATERQGTPSSEAVVTCELRVPVIEGLDEAIKNMYATFDWHGDLKDRSKVLEAARWVAELSKGV